MSEAAPVFVTAADGVRIAAHDLGGDGPPLVAAHGAGFHGLVFAPLARFLASHFHVVSFDFRGHGDSRLPGGYELDWYGLAADVLGVVDGMHLDRPFGFGHSSGATAILMAEEARPGTFAAIYCFEPVIVAADPPLGRDPGSWLAAQARRRRTTFDDRAEACRHYASKPPLDVLHSDALEAYVDHGFEDVEGGGVRLKCRPDDEAEVYETATAHDAYARLDAVRCPVMIACGSETEGCSPELALRHAAGMPAAQAEVLPGLGHFGPLERPDEVAASVRAFFSQCGARSSDHQLQ